MGKRNKEPKEDLGYIGSKDPKVAYSGWLKYFFAALGVLVIDLICSVVRGPYVRSVRDMWSVTWIEILIGGLIRCVERNWEIKFILYPRSFEHKSRVNANACLLCTPKTSAPCYFLNTAPTLIRVFCITSLLYCFGPALPDHKLSHVT